MLKILHGFVIAATVIIASQSRLVMSCHARKFIKHERMELQNHVNQTIRRLFPQLCWGECMSLPWCLSINVRNISESVYECDLNKSNKTAAGGLVPKPTSDYYEKTKPSKKICSIYNCEASTENTTDTSPSPPISPSTTIKSISTTPTLSPTTQQVTTQAAKPTTPQKSDCQLDFPRQSTADFVFLSSPFANDIARFTLSFWLKVPTSFSGILQIFSYKTNLQSDLSVAIKDKNGDVVEIKANGGEKSMKSDFKRDETWQNIIVYWNSEQGKVNVYNNGRLKSSSDGLSKDSPIKKDGTLYLGQKHKSDGFDNDVMIRGSIADFQMWDKEIASSHIYYTFKCQSSTADPGEILDWNKILNSTLEGSVTKTCPATCP